LGTDTLIDRVDRFLQAGKVPLEWGSPLLSTTPKSMAIQALAVRVEALEQAVREIAQPRPGREGHRIANSRPSAQGGGSVVFRVLGRNDHDRASGVVGALPADGAEEEGFEARGRVIQRRGSASRAASRRI